MGDHPGVYKLLNKITGDFYIGSSTSIRMRRHKHFSLLRRGIHWNPGMQSDFDLYGEDSFEVIPLIICEKSELIYYEQKCLDMLNPTYNLCKFADERRTYLMERWGHSPRKNRWDSAETKEKIRQYNENKLQQRIKEKVCKPFKYRIVSPDGVIYDVNNLLNFCRLYGISYYVMTRLVTHKYKKKKDCMGWTVYEEDTE